MLQQFYQVLPALAFLVAIWGIMITMARLE